MAELKVQQIELPGSPGIQQVKEVTSPRYFIGLIIRFEILKNKGNIKKGLMPRNISKINVVNEKLKPQVRLNITPKKIIVITKSNIVFIQ
jgi:hypothetical protein